mmetsp:Transcript_59845/g.142913  ORF Transcript_59845/g.142913 Transcript_59845/m.142913 type:complete len:227 (+) Transcript_59845:63-743(+)
MEFCLPKMGRGVDQLQVFLRGHPDLAHCSDVRCWRILSVICASCTATFWVSMVSTSVPFKLAAVILNALVLFTLFVQILALSKTQADPEAPADSDRVWAPVDSDTTNRFEKTLEFLCQAPLHQRRRLARDQVLMLLGAAFALRQSRASWGRSPDRTWGLFLERTQKILASRKADQVAMPLRDWFAVSQWCSSQSPDKLQAILVATLEFHYSPVPHHVMRLTQELLR